jgi:hypothetical protein
MNKQKRISIKIQSFAILAALCAMLTMPILATASAAAVATLTVVPTSNANTITVVGNGFDPSEPVYLALVNQTSGAVIYNFTQTATTTTLGIFTSDLTIPSLPYGSYYIYAKTSTASATKEYSITFITNPKIAASPANSNIIKVTGSGFTPNQVITFTLTQNVFISAYNFTDIAATDTLGNFTITLIVPTSINGNYTLMAQSRTGLVANTAIIVPDLTGPQGETGEDGDRGAKGATGPAGKDADSTLMYAAVILSVIAIVLSVMAFLKNRGNDEDEES